MELSRIATQSTEHEEILEAYVTADFQKKPVRLWYSVPSRFASYVNASADSFASVLLFQAMAHNEDLIIDGPISGKLLQNLYAIQKYVLRWSNKGAWPMLNHIRIVAPDQLSSVGKKSRRKGAFFSLGIDSKYTLHQTQLHTKEALDNLILVHGFDIPLSNEKLFKSVCTNAEHVAHETHIPLIAVKTNIRSYIEPFVGWEAVHGAALAGVAHFLSRGIPHIYFNSEDASITDYPYGTHPALDRLWSSDEVSITTYGEKVKRSQKTAILKDDPLAQKYLRVCWLNPDNQYNCSQCSKCIRTMLQLDAVGALEKFSTFKHTIPLSRLSTFTESKQRLFLWWDLLRDLPRNRFRARIAIVSLLIRSYIKIWMKALMH